jgi:CheY-like chemotaxis protein
MPESARILVVEDNEVNLMVFTDILAAAGYQVLAARTAEECFALAGTETPDLILMDIQLPGMDGLEAVKALKANPSTSGIPIVALTAHAMSSHRERALEAGCTGYITKPIRSREFREAVQGYLKGSSG